MRTDEIRLANGNKKIPFYSFWLIWFVGCPCMLFLNSQFWTPNHKIYLDRKRSFLNVLVNNWGVCCTTSINHKSSYTGVGTNFFRFIKSVLNKYNGLVSVTLWLIELKMNTRLIIKQIKLRCTWKQKSDGRGILIKPSQPDLQYWVVSQLNKTTWRKLQ